MLTRFLEWIAHERAAMRTRAAIDDLLALDDHLLDDAGYARHVLEAMRDDPEALGGGALQAARRRSLRDLRSARPQRRRAQISAGSVSQESSAACGGAC